MTLTKGGLVEIADELGATVEEGASYRPRYNVAPTDLHPVLAALDGSRRLRMWRWGMSSGRPGKPPLINARAETAALRGPFREAYAFRRCVIPADGFFEWAKVSGGARQPKWFHRADGKLLLFAGLWEEGPSDGQKREPRFAVITTAANALVGQTHDRMPAMLSPEEAAAWLAGPASALLRPAPEGTLVARAVSTRVNFIANDDPECLVAVGTGTPRGQWNLKLRL